MRTFYELIGHIYTPLLIVFLFLVIKDIWPRKKKKTRRKSTRTKLILCVFFCIFDIVFIPLRIITRAYWSLLFDVLYALVWAVLAYVFYRSLKKSKCSKKK